MSDHLHSRAAADFSLSELRTIWNEAYRDYFVPMSWSERELERHILVHDIDLCRSLVWLGGAAPIALSLAALRGQRAWIGGFGIVPEHRGRSISQSLFEEQVRLIDDAGARTIQLEVIDRNHARKVYERAGFVSTRALLTFRLDPTIVAEAADHDRDEAVEVLGELSAAAGYAWQREAATVEAMRDFAEQAVVVTRGAERVAAALISSAAASRRVIHAAARDDEAATQLVDRMAATSNPTLLVNEPEDSAIARVLNARTVRPLLTQVEMVR